jgi:hypothetical protein
MAKDGRKPIDLRGNLGLTRRDLLRRGAVVGGTLLWAAPAVQSITQPAFAQEQTGSVRYACCWCKHGGNPSAACGALGAPGSPLASDANCHAYCKRTNPGGKYEFHTSGRPFTCSPTGGCIEQGS